MIKDKCKLIVDFIPANHDQNARSSPSFVGKGRSCGLWLEMMIRLDSTTTWDAVFNVQDPVGAWPVVGSLSPLLIAPSDLIQ